MRTRPKGYRANALQSHKISLQKDTSDRKNAVVIPWKMYLACMPNMPVDRIYLSPPHLSPKAMEYLSEAVASNWIAPVGPMVTRFEETLKQYSGCEHCLALNSGTSALHLALIVAGVSVGDDVLCSTFTFAASAFPILYQKATPIFVESEVRGWNLCPDTLEQAILDRNRKGHKPKALVVAHSYGNPADMDAILDICDRHGVTVIEDAAEAVGSSLHGKAMGTHSPLGAYSFNGNKIITCSSGGALLCKDSTQAKHARKIAAQAKEPSLHFEHHEEGHNFLMSNLLAAVGVSQFEVLKERVEARRKNFENYRSKLQSTPGCQWQEELAGALSNRWLSAFFFAPESNVNALGWMEKLAAANIESRPLWKPMHTQKAFTGAPYYGNRLSEKLFANGICLPSGGMLTALNQQRILDLMFDTKFDQIS